MPPKCVLFLLPYPLAKAPSQRFRVEAFFEELENANIEYIFDTFLDEKAWQILYKKGSAGQKAWSVIKGFLRRLAVIFFKAPSVDFIFIHREAAPIGPPVFEWLLRFVFRKRILYDFDDAIWIPNVSAGNGMARFIKCFWKVKYICKWSHKVAAGNQYLADYAGRYNANVVLLPTCVDTTHRYNPNKVHKPGRPVIGWTGSHSTLKYLDALLPVLSNLEEKHDFDFLVICDKKPSLPLRSLRFIPWQERSEIEDLLTIDIGVMPLEKDPWSEGKCGFKIIQYLALGIPAVASPVGVNKTIIQEGVNGFLCTTAECWQDRLTFLLQNIDARSAMGQKGRVTIENEYSIGANAGQFISLFF